MNTGPSEPTNDALLAPIRRIDSAISHVGSTVENTAIANVSRWIDAGTSSAANGRVTAKWISTHTVDASIAHAMKRDDPSRRMTSVAPTR